MTRHLPRNLRRLLEQHGIEGDALSALNRSLTIRFDDLEVAFEVREATLDFHPCCLISVDGAPALLIHDILPDPTNQ